MSTVSRLAAFLLGDPLAPASARQREASPTNIDPDDDLYRSTGAARLDLTGSVLRRAQQLSIDSYRRNPLANRIIKIYVTYMAGEGFAVGATNPDVEAIVQEFWSAERNQMEANHRRFARDFLLYGELPAPVGVDELGNTTVGFIDPWIIDHVTTNKSNRLILESLVLSRSLTDGETLKIIRRDDDPFSDYAGLYTGEVFFWIYDRIAAATRGTPFLLPALDWLDAYDQTLWELLERTKAARAFFWDVEVDGDETDIEVAKKAWGQTAPRSGSVRFRSPGIRPSAAQPQLGAYEDVNTARYLLRHIATAAGVAPHWLGDPEDANRSTAQEMDKPVLRALEDTQAGWKSNMESLLKFVVDQKVAKGMLARVVPVHDERGEATGEMLPAAETVIVEVPQLTDDALEAAAAALTQVAQAFVQLDMIDVVDRDTLRKVIRTMLPALGVPADELPDPDEAEDDELDGAVESLYRRAARRL